MIWNHQLHKSKTALVLCLADEDDNIDVYKCRRMFLKGKRMLILTQESIHIYVHVPSLENRLHHATESRLHWGINQNPKLRQVRERERKSEENCNETWIIINLSLCPEQITLHLPTARQLLSASFHLSFLRLVQIRDHSHLSSPAQKHHVCFEFMVMPAGDDMLNKIVNNWGIIHTQISH